MQSKDNTASRPEQEPERAAEGARPGTHPGTQTGTKVAFIQEGIYENLGVMYLSAYLKQAGHSVRVFIESLESDMDGEIKDYGPDLVCFSVITGCHLWAYETAKRIKGFMPGALIVMGGAHPTFFKDSIGNDCIDVTCIGEGEGAMLEIADTFTEAEKLQKVANLFVKENGHVIRNEVRPFVDDIDSILFPDREPFYRYPLLRDAKRKTVLTSRGCPYNCSFCFNHQYKNLYKGKGKFIRIRSAENIIEEILEVKKNYGIESVFFQDDTFILNKRWLEGFLDKYKNEVGLPFTCLVRADLTDAEVAQWLKDAGCVGVQFGIESGDEDIRNNVLKKNLTDEQIINAAALYKKHGIKFKTYNMLGLPKEDLDSAFKTLELNARIGSDLPWASIMVPYPGTDIAEMMKDEGMIPPNYSIDDITKTFFDKKAVTREEKVVLNLQRLFFWGVKFPSLLPLIRRLIKLPPNFIFDAFFYMGQLYNYKVSENLDWLTSIRMGYNFVRINMLGKK